MTNIYIRGTFSRNRNRKTRYYWCIMGTVINRMTFCKDFWTWCWPWMFWPGFLALKLHGGPKKQ